MINRYHLSGVVLFLLFLWGADLSVMQQTVVFDEPVDADLVFSYFDQNHNSKIQYRYLIEPEFDTIITGSLGILYPDEGWPDPKYTMWAGRARYSREAGTNPENAPWYECWERDDCPPVYLVEVSTHNLPAPLLALGTVTQQIDLAIWRQRISFLATR